MEENLSSQANISTQEQIKIAAKEIFQQKGYSATRTRDIAKHAGINLALLNYYFRSKEKLFAIIMEESIKDFFFSITQMINDTETTIEQKIEQIVRVQRGLISQNPGLPIFIIGELQNGSTELFEKVGISRGFINRSYLNTQLCERLKENGNTVESINFILNWWAMSIFPFLMKPILGFAVEMSDEQFEQMVDDRQELIPKWLSIMLESKQSK